MFSFDDLSNELQFRVPKERQFIYNLGTSDQSKNSNGLYLQVSFFFDFFGFCLRLSRAVGKRATCSHSQAGEVGVRRYCELQFSSVLAHPSNPRPPLTQGKPGTITNIFHTVQGALNGKKFPPQFSGKPAPVNEYCT